MYIKLPKFFHLYLVIPVIAMLPVAGMCEQAETRRAAMGRTTVPEPAPSLLRPPLRSPHVSGRAALALIKFPWEQLGYKVQFHPRRPGYRALTFVDEYRIEVYVKAGESPEALAFDLAHEFGHIIDLKFNNRERRERWMKLRGIDPSMPWYGPSGCSDYATPAGDFAETFAYILLGPGSFHSQMAPPPRPEQIKELAELCRIEHISAAAIQK